MMRLTAVVGERDALLEQVKALQTERDALQRAVDEAAKSWLARSTELEGRVRKAETDRGRLRQHVDQIARALEVARDELRAMQEGGP